MAFTDTVRARMRAIRVAFTATRQVDRKLVPLMVGIPLPIYAALVALELLLLGTFPVVTIAGIPLALLIATFIFGRRAQRVQFESMRGRPGAAAGILEQMRGQWLLTPAVAFSRKQDLVHRVVGRCGVVLVGEGAKARTDQLLRQEQRKVKRVAGDTPIILINVGDGDGQVPLDKLRNHLMKQPRKLNKREVAAVNKRLASLPSGDMPVPKGPIPGGVKPPRPRNR